ncbi:ATP-dependent helicase [Miltoncostaea marina]|uniref:ATP-dependent helicase n=1 Tax=Miltoncostaea marina TaxID=2843215 RepID=UPI001C3DAE4D|nr:UvrD-helicase domain-containing protein [Miltoncostaea marina]
MSDPLDGLNPPQREAVLHGEGPLLVLAGAGSGKTRVLTHRVARLIGEAGVRPEAILAITFTNKAAGEMRERIGRLVGPRARAIWASTFHSACVRILRVEAPAAGYARDFSIYDADDQLRLIRRCLVEEEIDPKRTPPRAVQARISDAKSLLQGPEEMAAMAGSFADEVVARVYRRYAEALRANGAMDFDDLLMVTAQLLEEDAAVRARWQSRFEHVLVDEYQDTNHAQYRLVRVLAEPQRNVVAVGDDDQGIYSWRGADVRNILDFERDYPDAHVVALEQNYRSTGTILRAANAVVERNPHRHPKRLWTDLGDGEPITVMACRDEHEEARVVAAEIDRAVGRGASLSEVAVFYRTNAQSRAIEDQLVRRAVPYAVVGGPRFYERAEVRDLLAYLRVVANPADGVSLARMLGAPKRGLGPGCVAKLEAFAAARETPVSEGVLRPDEVPGLPPGQRATLAATGALLADVRQRAEAGAPLDRILEEVLERSGLRDALEREGTFEAQGRIENLEEMVRVAAEYDASEEQATLAGFLEGIALQADADLVDQSTGAVTLMTIHNAKGLEFDTVLITGLEEGLFPHIRSDTREALEEERRLFYVGLTRARRHLMLTHADSRAMHGGRDYRLPSRFLGELPADALREPAGGRRSRGHLAGMPADGGGGWRSGPPAPRVPALATGDSVLHATFGEGVVTAIESGGELVRVRFSQDGAERRLMAGAAPMRKVG